MSRINHTILIDDNKTTNFLNKYLMLKSKRFRRIEEFINGHKVLERFEKDQSFEPDIIFLDIDMADINGWEFLERFEKLYSKKVKTKIFILSSIVNTEYSKVLNAKHFTPEYLIKPLNLKLINSLYHKYFVIEG
ncbi:response regulator [Aquimarina sp. BL5]|uniref:response regulator n=1 Tax=Aquimarina sp. BL5 TaxID=1714860 RepID=UPI000E4FB78D|nr:response regulator [Aquimarina sp. BL5]AXT52116.1 response regulator [Aquimarina sp. BL5]RKN10772.1 response regulator [Aquimarina sp. BL5]